MNTTIETRSAPVSVFDERDIDQLSAPTANVEAIFDIPPDATPGHAPGSFTRTMTNAAYHSERAFISHSGMKELIRSPAHYLEYLLHPREESTPNVWSAIHAAVLEPDAYANDYITYDGHRRGKAWDEFKAKNEGKLILNVSEAQTVAGALASVQQFSDFPLWAALQSGEAEKSIFWTDQRSGAKCRIRVDNLTPHVIFDLKSTDDARPEAVARRIAQMDYDLQAYMYTEGVRAFTGKRLPFYFIFAESARPHAVCLARAGHSILANGYIKFRRGVEQFVKLCDSGDFSAYETSVYTAELPRYAMLAPAHDGELYDTNEV